MRSHEILSEAKIAESPIARHGNWEYDPANIGEFSKVVADSVWRKLDTITFSGDPIPYDVLRHKTENSWKVARLVTKLQNRTDAPYQVYDVVFFINFKNEKNVGYRLNYPRLYRSYSAGAASNMMGTGIARTMMRYFLEKLKYTIICDYEQYLGARRLWASLSRDPEFTVDAVNVQTDTIIQPNALVDHGPDDADIDPALWSFNDADAQRHIFFVLRLAASKPVQPMIADS